MSNGLKLFVDDIRETPQGWHLARTVTEAIRILSGPLPIEVCSLDHDIRLDSYNGKMAFSEEAFVSVARYIALMPRDRLPKIVYFHTSNPDGAREMGKILEGIVPTLNIGNDQVENRSDIDYKEILVNSEKEREQRSEEHKWEGEF